MTARTSTSPSTLATWLHEVGYRTGLIGKYLNRYPFGRLPYVPAGWDRFVAKRNQSGETVYRNFRAVEQGSQVFVREYATDWLADKAVGFVRTAPSSRPFFLLFAPSAPHPPWIPAERHEGTSGGLPVEEAPSVAGALRGAPPWVRSLPEPSAAQRAEWQNDRRRADETLLAVDDALRVIVDALGDRLDETVIFVLSDNGYSFGEHRWEGKRCPYDECVRIPLAVHSPWAPTVGRDIPVSIVDLAPTILDLARAGHPEPTDGASFARTIEPERGTLFDEPRHEAVFLEWAGDPQIPAWTAVRTIDLKLIRYEDGLEELYDIGGRVGSCGSVGDGEPRRRPEVRGSPRPAPSASRWRPRPPIDCRGATGADHQTSAPEPRASASTDLRSARCRAHCRCWRGSSGHPPARNADENPPGGEPDREPDRVAGSRQWRRPDPARDLPREREPVLRPLLRDLSGSRGRHRRRHDRGLRGEQVRGRTRRPLDGGTVRPPARSRPRLRARSVLDQRRQDERLQLRLPG